MDVTCERCRTEYVFDENLVSERGTTVKCTQCGHLFKVHRPGSAVPWDVRRQDGTVETLSTLEDVQQRIEHGLLSEDDEITRSGEPWRALGDVPELSPHFAAARARRQRGRELSLHSPPGHIDTPRPISSRPPPPAPPPAPRNPHAHARSGGTLLGVGTNGGAASSASGGPISDHPTALLVKPAGGSAAHAAPPPAASSTLVGVGPIPPLGPPPIDPSLMLDEVPTTLLARRAPRLEPTPAPERPFEPDRKSLLRVDEDDERPPPPSRGKRGAWIGIAVVAALLLAVASQWSRIARTAGVGPEAAEAPVANGASLIERDTTDGYRLAAEAFLAAHRREPSAMRPLVDLSRAHAYWAQLLLFDALDEDARDQENRNRATRASQLRRLAREHAEEAFRYAQRAVGLHGDEAAPYVASADARRMLGELTAARADLDRSVRLAPATNADPIYVDALLSADEREGDLAAALPEAERAVGVQPACIRCRLLLARAKLAAGDRDGALAEVHRVLADHPDHDPARTLLVRMEQAVPDAAVADAGGVPAPVPARPPGAPPPATDRTALEPSTAGGPAATATGGDYSTLVRRGEDLARRGDLARARSQFEAALAARPSSPEAQAGLGEVLLRSGSLAGAVQQLSSACQSGYAEACFHLGDAYRALGRMGEAQRSYQRYLDRYPSGPRSAQATRYVEALSGPSGAPSETPAPGGTP